MTRRVGLALIFGLALLSELPRLAVADIVIDGYTAAVNDRFTNSEDFIMSGFDLSGVAQTTSGRWATAISRNVVISAAHFPPSGSLFFYPGNDPTAKVVQRSVLMGARVPGTDLYLAVLNANLPSNIKHYTYATESLVGTPPQEGSLWSATSAGVYDGMNAYLFGRSPENRSASQDQAVGRNRISGYSENVPFGSQPDVDSLIFTRDASTDADFVDYEAYLQVGDSGGPAFVDMNGELRLLGTNAYIYDPSSFERMGVPLGQGSGINYTGNQSEFIGDFILANAIPEPHAALCLTGLALAATSRRRREKRAARGEKE